MDLTEAEDIKKRWQECTEDPLDFTFQDDWLQVSDHTIHGYQGH